MDTPAQRLRWAREKSGYTAGSDAARAFGWPISTYLGHENGDRNPSRDAAKKYGEAFKVPWVWILDGGPPPGVVTAEVEEPVQIIGTSQITNVPLPDPSERPDVPLWASAAAGDDGAMVLVPDPIAYLRRSERMLSVRNPFAFNVLGSSMSPAIEHGNQVIINPSIVARAGDDCVFIHEGPEGMLALVKRLVRPGSDYWRVRQFNEPRDFDISRKKWGRVHPIAEIRRGVG